MFHLITGGSGSGKSEYAEQKLMEYASHSKRNKKRYYIATMIPFGNEMYDPSGAGENAEESILAGIHKLQKVSDDLVVVTNEVFSDSMTDNPEMEEYLKLLGKLNLRMGERADLVTEVVYGIPVERKDIKK